MSTTFWSLGLHHTESAADWLTELQETLGENLLARTLELTAGATAEPDLDADRILYALMSMEVVAGMLGRAAPDLPHEVIDWLESHGEAPSAELLELCASSQKRLEDLLSDPPAPLAASFSEPWNLMLAALHDVARRLH